MIVYQEKVEFVMLSSSRMGTLSGPVVLFAALFLPGYLYQSVDGAAMAFSSDSMLLQNLVLGVPQALLILYVILTRGGTELESAGIVRIRFGDSLKILGVVVGIVLISGPIVIAGRYFAGVGFVDSISIGVSPISLTLLVLVCVSTGYREELFFRSYLLTEFAHRGQAKAIGASTMLFAVGHLYQGPIAFLGTVFIGIFLSLVFLRYRNIHVIAVGHGLYNLVIILIANLR